MKVSKVFAATASGYDSQLIEIECDTGKGIPGITIVGLPNKAVDEAKDRVRSALKHSGLSVPRQKITLNLAPADIPKDGSSYDVPMAIAILRASEQVGGDFSSKSLFVGELSLDGRLRSVPGVIHHVLTAKERGFSQVFVPHLSRDEARLIEGITIYPAKTLKSLYRHLTDEKPLKALAPLPRKNLRPPRSEVDFSDIQGQFQGKRALEIAAVGGHNILLNGPPGAGKTMLAKSLVSILPPMNRDEVIAVTKIHSLTSAAASSGVIAQRPFRSPHHTTSDIALIGGGQNPLPGEVSLAHNGVLFLDELPEFKRGALEVLRQPLEDGEITISRAKRSVSYPADFMLVATQNPCPCGFLNDEIRVCECSPLQIQRYQKKLSGPLLDRIDMRVFVTRVPHDKLLNQQSSEPSKDIASRVARARKLSTKRNGGITNSQLGNRMVQAHCHLDGPAASMLSEAMKKLDLSARGYMRTIKVARSIADLDASENITLHHISEALQYR